MHNQFQSKYSPNLKAQTHPKQYFPSTRTLWMFSSTPVFFWLMKLNMRHRDSSTNDKKHLLGNCLESTIRHNSNSSPGLIYVVFAHDCPLWDKTQWVVVNYGTALLKSEDADLTLYSASTNVLGQRHITGAAQPWKHEAWSSWHTIFMLMLILRRFGAL